MDTPRWLHRLAALTAASALGLIAVGAVVTSTDSGMAFRDWPTSAGRNLFTYPWVRDMLVGAWRQVVEHGHRLGGTLVGCLTLALAFSLWAREPRRTLKALGLLAAATVVLQGYLGGYRVLHDSRPLAFLHACTAHAFFALLVGIWTLTAPGLPFAGVPRIQRRCALGAALAYVQVILGAAVRQLGFPVRYHAGMACVLALFLCALSLGILKAHVEIPALRRAATAVAALVVAQSAFGLTAWLSLRHATHPRSDIGRVAHSVVHVATGALLLGATVRLAVLARLCRDPV